MYSKISYFFIYLCCLLLPVVVQAQTQSTIISSTVGDNNLTISASPESKLTFSLSTLPKDATIESCIFQITTASNLTAKFRLDLFLAENDTFPSELDNNNRLMAFMMLDAGVKKDSIISVEIDKPFISLNMPNNLSIKLKGALSAVVFVNKKTIPGYCPRLIITYSLPNTATQTNWAMSQADRQHTASTYSRFAGEKPSAWAANEVKNLTDVQTDLVMYANKIYAVGNKDGKTNLYAIEPYSKSMVVVAENLPSHSKQAMPAINGNGVLYYFEGNFAHCIELANGNKKTKQVITYVSEAPIASPTIGQDGTLYLVVTNNVYAYSPFPEHKQLWLYSLAGKKSPVTLNKAGTIAYFVSYEKDSIFAVNTSNGKKIAAAATSGLFKGDNEGATIPLVDNAGNVYISNRLTNAEKIDIFDEKLKPIRTVKGTKMSRPVMGAGDCVFWVNNGNLTKVTTTDVTIPLESGLSVHSIVADASNNVYCLDKSKGLYAYTDTDKSVTNGNVGTTDYQKAMIIAPDGMLYTATSSAVYKFSPTIYASDYTINATDIQQNNTVFRGKILNIPTNINVDKTQTFVGGKLVVKANGTSSPTFNTKANVNLIGNTGIAFQPGFNVKQGATLACKVGN